jgi:hypothetical protein
MWMKITRLHLQIAAAPRRVRKLMTTKRKMMRNMENESKITQHKQVDRELINENRQESVVDR